MGMAFTVLKDIAFDPGEVAFFRVDGIVFEP
jgi:hypothetical protein